MRLTLDTNVLVSAFIARRGHAANLLQLALTIDSVRLVLSQPILREFEDVLMRNEVRERFEYTRRDIQRRVDAIREAAIIVPVRSTFRAVKRDPENDIILNTAYDGKADYLVSGDRDLLAVGRFKGITVVNVRRTIEIISRRFPEFVLPSDD